MAQGDITEVETDIVVDLKANRVYLTIQRLIELPTGELWSLDSRTETRSYNSKEEFETKPIADVKLEVRSKKVTDGILGTSEVSNP